VLNPDNIHCQFTREEKKGRERDIENLLITSCQPVFPRGEAKTNKSNQKPNVPAVS
jgi:hypothetical protein